MTIFFFFNQKILLFPYPCNCFIILSKKKKKKNSHHPLFHYSRHRLLLVFTAEQYYSTVFTHTNAHVSVYYFTLYTRDLTTQIIAVMLDNIIRLEMNDNKLPKPFLCNRSKIFQHFKIINTRRCNRYIIIYIIITV